MSLPPPAFMPTPLRAMILGCGFAGQGHARALRACGVRIEAISGRNRRVVTGVAEELRIPNAVTDWRGAMSRLRPDIVAVATPAGAHATMIRAALVHRCHLLVEKPLAADARQAEVLNRLAERTGVKTAYAATFRYQPAVALARELIDSGKIGPVREVECVSHYGWPRLTSFGWPHRLATGGGRLNNNFTHLLAMVLAVVRGEVTAVAGETRNDLGRVPVGPPSHDFREFVRSALTPAKAARCEWREVDSDWAYTVLARIATGDASRSHVSATFRHSALALGKCADYIAFYGDQGTLHIDGAYAQGPVHLERGKRGWRRLAVPRRIRRRLPAITDDVQRNWTQLAREFVADIRGEGDAGYLKFRDGWKFQRIIDAVRRGRGWTSL